MEANNKLRWGILIGIFLVPFIPLFVSNSILFPFISGKNFAFRIIVEIIFGLWLILAIRDRTYRPKYNPLLIAFGLLVVVIGIADFAGINPFRSIWSNFERMDGLITQVHLFLYFLVLTSVLNTQKLWNYLFNTSIFVSIIMSCYGLLQLAGKLEIHQGASRLDATLGNSAYLALYMLFHIFLTLFLLLRTKKENLWTRIIYVCVIFLETLILYYTATRGAILGLLGGMFLALILIAIFERERKTLRKIAFSICGGILILVLGFFALKNTSFVANSPVLSRFSSISIGEGSNQARLVIWSIAWQGFKERPILGWGQENFIVVFEKYYDPKIYNQEPWFDRTHNVILDWLIAGGILGVVTYLSLFVISLYVIWKKKTPLSLSEKALFTGLLAGYFFHNLFIFDNIVSYFLFATMLAYFSHLDQTEGVVPAVQVPKQKVPTIESGAGEGMQSILIPLVIIAIPLSVYFVNIPAIIAGQEVITALNSEQNFPNQTLNDFKDSLAGNTFASGEAREQLLESAIRVARSTQSNDFKQTYALYAVDQMQKQITEAPLDARYPSFLGQFLLQAGAPAQASKDLELAVKLAPKKQDILSSLAVAYFLQKDYPKAYDMIERAFNVFPAYDDIRIVYAAIAVYDNKNDVAEKVLSERYGTLLVPDPRLLESYARNKVLEKFLTDDAALVAKEQKSGQFSAEKLAEIKASEAKFYDLMAAAQKASQAGQ